MSPELIISGAAFAAISCAVWAVLTMLSGNKSRAAERLEELRDPGARKRRGEDGNKVGNLMEKAAPTLSKALEPQSETEQSHLKTRLANAGFSHPNAPRNYLALKIVSLVLGITFGSIYGFASAGFSKDFDDVAGDRRRCGLLHARIAADADENVAAAKDLPSTARCA